MRGGAACSRGFYVAGVGPQMGLGAYSNGYAYPTGGCGARKVPYNFTTPISCWIWAGVDPHLKFEMRGIYFFPIWLSNMLNVGVYCATVLHKLPIFPTASLAW